MSARARKRTGEGVKAVRGADATAPFVGAPGAECACVRRVLGAVSPVGTDRPADGSGPVRGSGGRISVAIDRIWSYASDSGHVEGQDLTGFTVAASDGTLGRVDRQADPFGKAHLVVDTGVWVFGTSVLVPVGVVTGIDPQGGRITLACTGAEVKAAPRFQTDSETRDREYLAAVGAYYLRLVTTA